MAFRSILNPKTLRSQLQQLLDAVTSPAVLNFDQLFYASHDRYKLIAEFEATSLEPQPKRSPQLLLAWTNYCWLRLELGYLAEQRAALNVINQPHPVLIAHSIDHAILEDAGMGVPIERSFAYLSQMLLQIVGTEHPTDPLAQNARDLLTKLGNLLEDPQTTSEDISLVLKQLLNADPIPPGRRSVEEEVNRNIHTTLDKLYDIIPTVLRKIFGAYRKAYGEAIFRRHKPQLMASLNKSRLFRDASWAGFDADGNENVTPDTMRYAIRLHRIRISEKHVTALDEGLIDFCKQKERILRDEISECNRIILLCNTQADLIIIPHVINIMAKAYKALSNRNFTDLNYCYLELEGLSQNLNAAAVKQVAAARSRALQLIKLTKFSGKQVEKGVFVDGALQVFKRYFKAYKAAVRDNTDAYKIEDAKGIGRDPSLFMIERYDQLLKEHSSLLNADSDLNDQAFDFAQQLRAFGMTYGAGHIRQDSSVFRKVWILIFTLIVKDLSMGSNTLVQEFHDKPYAKLSDDQRLDLHLSLQGSAPGQALLIALRDKFRAGHFRKGENALIHREMDRLQLALHHPDIIDNLIISNCESAANIFEVESLLAIFASPSRSLTVVPLLEKREDLEAYAHILIQYFIRLVHQHLQNLMSAEDAPAIEAGLLNQFYNLKSRSEFKDFLRKQPFIKAILSHLKVEVMVGFSDTERVSGLPALISIQKVKEEVIRLAHDFGVTPKIYSGPGGDANRGGLRRHDTKATLQGNARNNVLNTPEAAVRFREQQFYEAYRQVSQPELCMEIKTRPAHIQRLLNSAKVAGTKFYEHLHTTEGGLGKLLGFMLGQGAHWMVALLNSSSRTTQRGIAEIHSDRTLAIQSSGVHPEPFIHPDKPRAISATQIKELLRDNIGLLVGSGRALTSLGLDDAQKLYEASATIRDLVQKTLFGLVRTDFSFLMYALFSDYPDLYPKSLQERKAMAKECKDTFVANLGEMDVEALAKHPEHKYILMEMLAKLVAYLAEELDRTRTFMSQLVSRVQDMQTPDKEVETLRAALPLNTLLARQNAHVAAGRYLDVVYPTLNELDPGESHLSGVGRLLGNIGAGLIAFWIMPPSFHENIYLDYSQDLRQGTARAEAEAFKLDRYTAQPKLRNRHLSEFFSVGKAEKLEQVLRVQLQNRLKS